MRREALLTLARLPPERALGERLVREVSSRDPWIRAAALAALEANDRDDFALVLSGMDPDRDFRVRAALAGALGRSGNEMSVGILHAMLRDEDPRVVSAVLGALATARGKDSLDTQRRHLEHPDLGVRVAAAEAVSSLSPAGMSEPLVAAWRRGLGDGEGELEGRLAAVAALAAQKDAAAPGGPRRGGAPRPGPRGARPSGDAPPRGRRARRSTRVRSGSRARRSTTARRSPPTTPGRAYRSTRRAPS